MSALLARLPLSDTQHYCTVIYSKELCINKCDRSVSTSISKIHQMTRREEKSFRCTKCDKSILSQITEEIGARLWRLMIGEGEVANDVV